MIDVVNLAYAIVGGLAVAAIQKLWRAFHQKSVRDDIELLEWERKHLGEMKRSSVEMSRSGFRWIFAFFILVSLANIAPVIVKLFLYGSDYVFADMLGLSIWMTAFLLSTKFYRRYGDLKDFRQAMQRIEGRLEQLSRKDVR